MTMNVQSESVELPLKWESRNHVLEVADGFPTKNKNTDATIVMLMSFAYKGSPSGQWC